MPRPHFLSVYFKNLLVYSRATVGTHGQTAIRDILVTEK